MSTQFSNSPYASLETLYLRVVNTYIDLKTVAKKTTSCIKYNDNLISQGMLPSAMKKLLPVYHWPNGIPAEAFSPINAKEKLIFQSAMMQIFLGRQTFLREMLAHFTLLLEPYSDLERMRLLFINENPELSNSTEATDFLLQQFAISSALLSRGPETTSESVPMTEESSSSSSSSTAPTISTATTTNRNTTTSTNTTSNRDSNRELTSLVRSLQNEMKNMKSLMLQSHSLPQHPIPTHQQHQPHQQQHQQHLQQQLQHQQQHQHHLQNIMRSGYTGARPFHINPQNPPKAKKVKFNGQNLQFPTMIPTIMPTSHSLFHTLPTPLPITSPYHTPHLSPHMSPHMSPPQQTTVYHQPPPPLPHGRNRPYNTYTGPDLIPAFNQYYPGLTATPISFHPPTPAPFDPNQSPPGSPLPHLYQYANGPGSPIPFPNVGTHGNHPQYVHS